MERIRKQMKRIIYMALFIGIVFLCTGCGERKEKQLESRELGITYMEQGKYEDALVAFQDALDESLGEIGETEMDICFYKAECLYRLGDTQGAMDVYTAIITFNKNAEAYFLRGNLYYSQNDEENALADYAAALEQDEKNYELYIGVYEALIAHGKDKEASEYLNQALEISSNKAYDKMQKGRIHFMLGETEKAITLLEEAIKGKEVQGYYYLAEIYSLAGDVENAEKTMGSYIESGKADSYHLFNIANDQIKKGNYDMAVECINLALSLEEVPNKQILMKTLVIAYEQNLDFASAKKAMEQYVQAYPEDEDAKREFTFLETR